jgi:TolA-binding protein
MQHKKTNARHVGALLLMVGTGSVSAFADAPDEQYKYASGLYGQRLYSLASKELKKFVDENPTHPQAKIAAYQYAAALFRADNDKKGPDYAAAAAAYESALQKYATAPAAIVNAARFELGEAYFFLDKPEKAIAPLTEFLKNPGAGDDATEKAAWANYYIGKGLQVQKKFAEAKAAFERIRDNYANSEPAPDAVMELGVMALDTAQGQAAANAFRTVLEKYPKAEAAPEAKARLGDALFAANNLDAARDAYKAALADAKTAPWKSDVLLGLAGLDFTQKKWPDAAQGFAQVLNLIKPNDPRRASVQLRLANSHYNAKNYDAALAAYAPILGNTDAAIGPNALYFAAASQFAQKKYSEAAGNYRKVVEGFPQHALAAKAALRMGDAYAQAKDPARAAEAYKIVLTKYEKSDSAKEAQEALADLAGTAGSSAAVESVLRDLPASAVGNAKLRLAQAAYDKEDWPKAAQLAQSVADAKPDAATAENALYLAAMAKLNAKDTGAAQAFRNVIAAHPQGKLAGQARLGLAWALDDAKNYTASADAARQAVTSLSGELKDRAQLTLAGALFNGGKHKEAAMAFAVVESSTDKTFAAQAAQGSALALEKQNLWREAAGKWAKYATLSADAKAKSDALLRQGLALAKAKDGGALAAFDAALAADPKGEAAAEALYESAWLLHDQKNADEAARWARLEAEFPASKFAAEAAFQQGEIALEAKKYDDAANAYRRVTTKWPQSDIAPRAAFQLGTALYNAEKWAEAASAFDKAGATTKKEAFAVEAPYWAAESYRRAGKLNEAATRYEAFVTNIEGTGAAPVALKEYLPAARLGWGASISDSAKAATIFQPALAGAKGITKTELQFRLGEALFKQNKFAEALPHLLQVPEAAQWSANAQWLAAQALENTGAKSDALALYRKLAERQPATEWTPKAQEKVKGLE